MIKLWGKNRETLNIRKAAAARAIYQGADLTQTDIEIKLITTDGEKLTLIMKLEPAANLIQDMSIAYEAAVPRLHTGRVQSDWQGME